MKNSFAFQKIGIVTLVALAILVVLAVKPVFAAPTLTDWDGDGILNADDSTTLVTSSITVDAGEYEFQNLEITNNAMITLKSNPSNSGFKGVSIAVDNLNINIGSVVTADGQGYLLDGPGAGSGSCGGGGGGYGGRGGDGNYGIGGSVYGSPIEPVDLGSVGSGGTSSRGGGAIRLIIHENFVLEGTISANGLSMGKGGGSGGSLYITTYTLSGLGTIRANGGKAGSSCEGGGGGGRIALYYLTSTFTGNIQTHGGTGIVTTACPNTRVNGEDGTVVVLETQPSKERVKGIDAGIRALTGITINWDQVHSAGYRFAIIEATEGIDYPEPGSEKALTVKNNVENAKNKDLLVGVYHFARPVPNKDNAKEEAESFVKLAAEYIKPGYLRPFLDVEDNDYGEYPETLRKEPLAEWIKDWMDTVESRTGVKPILYMNKGLFSFLSDSSIVNKYDVWIADVDNIDPDPMKDNPDTGGWNTWAFWQYKWDSPLAGGTADLDVFNGAESKLDDFIIPNKPPIARIKPGNLDVKSGDVIAFDASQSYDPDGNIVSYHWDFGDGEEMDGISVPHRYIGTQDLFKGYLVTLTVEDNLGAKSTTTSEIRVFQIKKTIENTYTNLYDPSLSGICQMNVLYNWLSDDTYMISSIEFESTDYSGLSLLSVWDLHSTIWSPIWQTGYIFSGGSGKSAVYTPELNTATVNGEIFKGIIVQNFDGMQMISVGYSPGVHGGTSALALVPTMKVVSGSFQPDSNIAPNVPVTTPVTLWAQKFSPGELRVVDTQGRITGVVNQEIKNEIPDSQYDNDMIILVNPFEPIKYQVVGDSDGQYGLVFVRNNGATSTVFTSQDLPMTTSSIQQFDVNWDLLSNGGNGVTVQIDSNGDGTFEKSFMTGTILTRDEYTLKTDTTPPQTAINPQGTIGTNGWFISDVTVTLTATDNPGGSGVASTDYSFDGSTWVSYTDPVAITTQGTTTVFYYSTDKAGNVEETKQEVINIQQTPSTPSPEPVPEFPTMMLPTGLIVGFAAIVFLMKSRIKSK